MLTEPLHTQGCILSHTRRNIHGEGRGNQARAPTHHVKTPAHSSFLQASWCVGDVVGVLGAWLAFLRGKTPSVVLRGSATGAATVESVTAVVLWVCGARTVARASPAPDCWYPTDAGSLVCVGVATQAADRSSGVTVRVATEADRASMAQLVVTNHLALSADAPAEWVLQLLDVPSDFRSLLHAETFASGWFVLALSGDAVVGCVGMAPAHRHGDAEGELVHGDAWTVTAVSVNPGFRRRGIAGTLLDLVISHARDVGIKSLRLITLLELMEPAWRLYEARGFVRVQQKVVATHPRPMTVLEYELGLQ